MFNTCLAFINMDLNILNDFSQRHIFRIEMLLRCPLKNRLFTCMKLLFPEAFAGCEAAVQKSSFEVILSLGALISFVLEPNSVIGTLSQIFLASLQIVGLGRSVDLVRLNLQLSHFVWFDDVFDDIRNRKGGSYRLVHVNSYVKWQVEWLFVGKYLTFGKEVVKLLVSEFEVIK